MRYLFFSFCSVGDGTIGCPNFTSLNFVGWNGSKRRSLICAVDKNAEIIVTKTVDRLIAIIQDADDREDSLPALYAQTDFYMHSHFCYFGTILDVVGVYIYVIYRFFLTSYCFSFHSQKDCEEMAAVLMNMVDCRIHKTKVIGILIALNQREKLDKGFPAEVNAQLGAIKQVRIPNVQEKEDEDKPGLEAMLHKFLYASRVFFKLSYAKKGQFTTYMFQFISSFSTPFLIRRKI
ncbi:uncharacterized protein LOC125189360 [Salvia hispanica]|uniref:uncharacterized protein LOC125189360 n=1 Tax=Salvia hispanica TaxID=49212 RepID=UPI00200966DC|nr:uncharacterized protein LOC125189360 [Salvia hispanica]